MCSVHGLICVTAFTLPILCINTNALHILIHLHRESCKIVAAKTQAWPCNHNHHSHFVCNLFTLRGIWNVLTKQIAIIFIRKIPRTKALMHLTVSKTNFQMNRAYRFSLHTRDFPFTRYSKKKNTKKTTVSGTIWKFPSYNCRSIRKRKKTKEEVLHVLSS